ncbi:MAG: hypothetical protein V4701_06435 [Pseudomonadota bacterium]
MSIIVAVWAAMQGLMQIGGLEAGAPTAMVGWLLISYTLLPLSGVAIAWWRWAANRNAQAWTALVVIGAGLQFVVGPAFAR